MARRTRTSGWLGLGRYAPSMPDGEPLLQRWFVIPMVVLVVVGIGVSTWMAVTVLGGERITVAERRPPGTAQVTHERGQAVLNETTETEPGPGCATDIELFGDRGARGTGRAALEATCRLLRSNEFSLAQVGLSRWIEADGQLRIAVFELTGVESSMRVEAGDTPGEATEGADAAGERIVLELNPRFQFEPGRRAAPMVVHELVHLATSWPGEPVTAEAEFEAMRYQYQACRDLGLMEQDPPRGCLDAELLTDAPDGVQQLVDAGYRRDS